MKSFVVLVIFVSLCSGQQGQCCGPHGCVTVNYDASPPQPTNGDTDDCFLPNNPDLYYVPGFVIQRRSWSNMPDLYINGSNNGWALDPRFRLGCLKGAWCPYACNSPLIETQFDYLLGQPWSWEDSCNGQNILLGSGRRVTKCPTAAIPANPACAGGQNGMYCNLNAIPEIAAPSAGPPLNYQNLCMPGANAVEILNDTPWKITTCRTVFPGTEIPQIPTEILPGQLVQLTTPIVQTSTGGPAWWTAGGTTTVGLQFYFMRPQLPGINCVDPVCQWIVTRPGITANSQGGIDYTPYIIEWVPSSIANKFTISVRMNVDASVQPNSGYAGALGAPGYGLQLIDPTGALQCDSYWDGPLTANGATDNCGAICLGQGCANNQTCGGDCAQTLPNCAAAGMQCSSIPVQPRMNTGAGTPFAEGAGLSKACAVGDWDIDNPPAQRIRIRLYPYCNGGTCPTSFVGGTYAPPPPRPTSPTYPTIINTNNAINNIQQTSQNGKLSGGAIAGIVIAILAVFIIVALIVAFLVYRRRRATPALITQKTVEVNIQNGGSVPASSSQRGFSFRNISKMFRSTNPNGDTYVMQRTATTDQETPQGIIEKRTTTEVLVDNGKAEIIQEKQTTIKPLPTIPGKALPKPPVGNRLKVGDKVTAVYTGDQKEYTAVIEDDQNGYFLVKYVDFEEEREWLAPSSVRKV